GYSRRSHADSARARSASRSSPARRSSNSRPSADNSSLAAGPPLPPPAVGGNSAALPADPAEHHLHGSSACWRADSQPVAVRVAKLEFASVGLFTWGSAELACDGIRVTDD